ncbi:unnamed protein product [Clonostachys solani]|uniref:Uncharacterized protein n=1 Tax=Clonostachys solani TaxID=160281 RepID=A0A9N9ZKR1_9HYPO|nr:unnamed protein product [Clonostachys solani]
MKTGRRGYFWQSMEQARSNGVVPRLDMVISSRTTVADTSHLLIAFTLSAAIPVPCLTVLEYVSTIIMIDDDPSVMV